MDEWLKSKLIEMDLDESVYLPFIMTILEDDSMDNEAKSAEIKDYIGDQPNIVSSEYGDKFGSRSLVT